MSLDEFKSGWKENIDTANLMKSLADSREDEEAFDEYYAEFKKRVGNRGKYTDENGQERNWFIQPDDAPSDVKIAHASAYVRGVGERVLGYSNKNLESILNDTRTEMGDDFADFIAGIKPGVDEPALLVNAINNYRDTLEPLRGDKPNLKKIREGLEKRIKETMSMEGDEGYFAKSLQNLYKNSDQIALFGYKEHFIEPKKQKLVNAINTNDWNGYMRANIEQLKKPEKIGFYLDLYKRFSGDYHD